MIRPISGGGAYRYSSVSKPDDPYGDEGAQAVSAKPDDPDSAVHDNEYRDPNPPRNSDDDDDEAEDRRSNSPRDRRGRNADVENIRQSAGRRAGDDEESTLSAMPYDEEGNLIPI